jgi:hypothetical protein
MKLNFMLDRTPNAIFVTKIKYVANKREHAEVVRARACRFI